MLSAQVEVEAPGNSTVWRHVYSLNASDCERLGVDRNYMKNLIALKADELAKHITNFPQQSADGMLLA